MCQLIAWTDDIYKVLLGVLVVGLAQLLQALQVLLILKRCTSVAVLVVSSRT